MNSTSKILAVTALAVLVAAVPLVGPALGYPVLTKLATEVAILAIAALALNLVLGDAGLVSFGHAAYFGLGGYVVAIANVHFVERSKFLALVAGTNELIATLIVAMAAGGLLGCLFGLVALRTRKAQFIIITLALAQMMFFLFVSLRQYGGDDGVGVRRRNTLPLVDTGSDTAFYYVCVAIALLVLLLLLYLRRSRFGFVVSAIRQNERRVVAAGLVPFRFQLLAMTISGALTALAGALMANHLKFVSPEMLGWVQSGDLMMMVILGGVGSAFGPVLGAAAFVALENLFVGWTTHWQIGVGAVLLTVVMLSKEGGLLNLLNRIAGRPSP